MFDHPSMAERNRRKMDHQQESAKTTMKKTFLTPASRNVVMRLPLGFGLAFASTFLRLNGSAADVNLGTANNYAVLAGSTITSTGPTVITGGLGLTPGSAETGSPVVNGLYDIDNASAVTAQNDLTTAYTAAAGLPSDQNLTGQDLGGLTLTPGVYSFSSSAQLTGTLTLNGEGSPDPVFIFQIGSSFTTASGSSVVTINDDGSTTPGISVYWQVGSSATLGTTTAFEGTIMALQSITADTGATDLDGRLLARNGAVTLDDNVIAAPPAEVIVSGVPEPQSTTVIAGVLTLFPLVVGTLQTLRKRRTA
jgi:type VI secretion system secreted protein VgrG